MDNGKKQIMMVVILDLLAAFDTVDHDLILTILIKHFGICAKALEGSTATYGQDSSENKLEKTTHTPSNYTSV